MEKWQKGKHRQGIVKPSNWNSVFVEHEKVFFSYALLWISKYITWFIPQFFYAINYAFIWTKIVY